MNNTEYIESYFTTKFTAEQAREFENRIEADPTFAEEVAFYLSALNISREVSQAEKKEYFKKLYLENKAGEQIPIRNIPVFRSRKNISEEKKKSGKLLFYLAAAAVVVGIILGIRFFNTNTSPQQLAIKFEKENLNTLGVSMSDRIDSIQKGLNFYNEGKFSEALSQFETFIQSDTANSDAKKYAGLSALRLKKYDIALKWFGELQTYTLYANPAIFYQALTLMDRNQPGDDARAEQLLQEVVKNKLEREETAREWLNKFNN